MTQDPRTLPAPTPPTTGRRRRVRARALLGLLLMVASLVLLLGIDFVVGLVSPSLGRVILSSPRSAARFVTDEFDVTAHNNSLGLRGPELTDPRPVGGKRVLFLGDSFTWGWGVPDDASWPAVAGRLLRERGMTEVEVANAAQPGADPRVYALNALRSIPIVKPDLVVVGILQGDDYEQLRLEPGPVSWVADARRFVRWLFPNLLGLAQSLRTQLVPMVDIGELWRRQAARFSHSLSGAPLERLSRLDPAVRRAFDEGRFNPFHLSNAIRTPDYFLHATRPDGLVREQSMLADCLRVIARMAAENQADLLVVSVPYPVYVSPAAVESHRRLGFDGDASLASSDAPDGLIRTACAEAGIPCVSVNPAFRKAASRSELFFPLDGHLNAQGHRFLAGQLVDALQERLGNPGSSQSAVRQ